MDANTVILILQAAAALFLVLVTYQLVRVTKELASNSEEMSVSTNDQTASLNKQVQLIEQQTALAEERHRLNQRGFTAAAAPYLVLFQKSPLGPRPSLEFVHQDPPPVKGGEPHFARGRLTNLGRGPAVWIHVDMDAGKGPRLSCDIPYIERDGKDQGFQLPMTVEQARHFKNHEKEARLTIHYEDVLGARTEAVFRGDRVVELPGEELAFWLVLTPGAHAVEAGD